MILMQISYLKSLICDVSHKKYKTCWNLYRHMRFPSPQEPRSRKFGSI
jgi:hypothetical protein